MATISAFRAIRPNPAFADQLVLAKPQAESVAGILLPPLKDLLETPARQRPETPEGQARSYRHINQTLEVLLAAGKLRKDTTPGIYIYEVEHPGYRQTGIWAMTALEDYRNGRIRIHELTLEDSVRRMANYSVHTGLEGSPILLTYAPDHTIDLLIRQTKGRQQPVTLGNSNGVHRLWKIEDKHVQQQLIAAFAAIAVVYLADGHHRLASAAGETISSLYMNTSELRIREYDRVVMPGGPLFPPDFLKEISAYFQIVPSAIPVRPKQPGWFGLFIDGHWYDLLAKNQGGADAAFLQDAVLRPLLGITDPRTDPRLKCVGGGEAIIPQPQEIVFTLCPLTVQALIEAAEAGQVLPPKSTWIDPKIPYGLILYQHENH